MMRRAVLVIALSTASLTGCAALAFSRGDDPRAQLAAGLAALQVQDYSRAKTLLRPLYMERWSEPVGQRAMLALVAAELDGRNPERSLWTGADIAGRLLNVPTVEPWMVPVAESYYLLAVELGAQEELLASADSARAAAEARAVRAEQRTRAMPTTTRESVPAQLARVREERDAAKKRADQLTGDLAARDKELRETKQELERIRKIIKP